MTKYSPFFTNFNLFYCYLVARIHFAQLLLIPSYALCFLYFNAVRRIFLGDNRTQLWPFAVSFFLNSISKLRSGYISLVFDFVAGNTIEDVATQNNLNVVPSFAGHGIGSYFHGPPDINHYGKLVTKYNEV